MTSLPEELFFTNCFAQIKYEIFSIALEVLRVERLQNTQEVQKGVELGKKQLRAVMNTINSNIEMGTVINAGPFLYMLLKEGNPEHHMFAHPCSIRLLGNYY